MTIITRPCELEAHWHINHFCNFTCTYCFYKGNRKKAFRGLDDSARIIQGFRRLDRRCLINISGGEPFFAPHFVALCVALSAEHRLALNTNLSHKEVYHFAEAIDPGRVRYINCSVHQYDPARNIDDFIEKYQYLEKKGFKVFASYVLDPRSLPRFDEDYRFFKERGIIVRPKVFRGLVHRGRLRRMLERLCQKPYPERYSADEKAFLRRVIARSEQEGGALTTSTQDIHDGRMLDSGLDHLFLDGLPSFKGRLCCTGQQAIRIGPTGKVNRCHGGKHYLGNIFYGTVKLFDKPRSCAFNTCTCPYMGYSYVM